MNEPCRPRLGMWRVGGGRASEGGNGGGGGNWPRVRAGRRTEGTTTAGLVEEAENQVRAMEEVSRQ